MAAKRFSCYIQNVSAQFIVMRILCIKCIRICITIVSLRNYNLMRNNYNMVNTSLKRFVQENYILSNHANALRYETSEAASITKYLKIKAERLNGFFPA